MPSLLAFVGEHFEASGVWYAFCRTLLRIMLYEVYVYKGRDNSSYLGQVACMICMICMIYGMSPGWDLYDTDRTQHLMTAG